LRWVFIIMLPIAINQYFVEEAEVTAVRGGDSIVNNVSYLFVFFIPYLFLFRKYKILSAFLAFVVIFFIIQGAKRGALVAGGLSMLIFLYYQITAVNQSGRLQGYFFAAIIGLALVMYAREHYSQNEFLVARMEAIGSGSYS